MNSSTFRIATIALVVGLLVSLFGCMDASLSQSGRAPASISIQDAPDAIPELGVSITGGGANISETVGPGTDALVFELPVGQKHEVSIDATNFIGRKSFVLPPGGAQVDVQMLEKLFIPDLQLGTLSPRLVQVSDMAGRDWVTSSNVFYPMDVELGSDGSIYVAAIEDTFERFGRIRRLNSILDTSPVDIAFPYGVQAIAIDSAENLIYYAGVDGNSLPYLERVSPDGTAVGFGFGTTLISTLFDASGIWGLALDAVGDVYVSGEGADPEFSSIQFEQPQISKIDSSTGKTWSILLPFVVESAPDAYQSDVVVKQGKLYATNPGGPDGYKILEIDPETGEITDHFGTYPADPQNPAPGEFFAPRRFIATSRGKLYLIDEGSAGVPLGDHRVLSFDTTLDTSAWEVYGTEGTAEDEFDFYLQY